MSSLLQETCSLDKVGLVPPTYARRDVGLIVSKNAAWWCPEAFRIMQNRLEGFKKVFLFMFSYFGIHHALCNVLCAVGNYLFARWRSYECSKLLCPTYYYLLFANEAEER